MKIYFAASIRGGCRDEGLYVRLIGFMKQHHTVLTEQIAHPEMEKGWDDAAIFRRDMAWLEEADVVIAEGTQPSLGVGYEMARAERLGKPVHIFFNSAQARLSAMLGGNPYFHIHPYTDPERLFDMVEEALGREEDREHAGEAHS